MKVFTLLLLVLSLLSCDIVFQENITAQYTSNPFLQAYDISRSKNGVTASTNPDTIEFVAITDVHKGRDTEDKGIKYFDENFFSYLDSDKPSFILCLGDLSDDGKYGEELRDFVNDSAQRTETGWFVYCIGNHERHVFDDGKWHGKENTETSSGWDLLHFSGTMARYVYGEILSIYKLDNSMRILGQQQMAWLEEALREDNAKYKIIITHDNVTTGGVLDQSLFITGVANIQERNRLYRLMNEYGVGLILSGHHHKGNIQYKMSPKMGELNLAAYHQRKTLLDFESEGYFYRCSLDVESGRLTIDGYLAEFTSNTSRKPDKRYIFDL